MNEIIKNLYGCRNVYGPYIGDDGRKRCVLYFEKGKTISKSYARLLKEAQLGRILLDTEEVDHRDDDKTNDDINNLQVTTALENVAKHYVNKIMDNVEFYGFECAWCETSFILSKSQLSNKPNQTKTGLAFCCRKCSVDYSLANGIYTINPPTKKTDQAIIDNIRKIKAENPELSHRKIGEMVGASNTTVRVYLNN